MLESYYSSVSVGCPSWGIEDWYSSILERRWMVHSALPWGVRCFWLRSYCTACYTSVLRRMFQQDNARAHRARETINLLERETYLRLFHRPFDSEQPRCEPGWLKNLRRNAASVSPNENSRRRWTEAAANRCMAWFQSNRNLRRKLVSGAIVSVSEFVAKQAVCENKNVLGSPTRVCGRCFKVEDHFSLPFLAVASPHAAKWRFLKTEGVWGLC